MVQEGGDECARSHAGRVEEIASTNDTILTCAALSEPVVV